MSFDVVVLNLDKETGLLQSLEEVGDVRALGSRVSIRQKLDKVLPGVRWSTETFGLYQAPQGFRLELSLSESELPESLHFTLHFGERWEEVGALAFDKVVLALYQQYGWQSFAVSDNSALVQPPEANQS